MTIPALIALVSAPFPSCWPNVPPPTICRARPSARSRLRVQPAWAGTRYRIVWDVACLHEGIIQYLPDPFGTSGPTQQAISRETGRLVHRPHHRVHADRRRGLLRYRQRQRVRLPRGVPLPVQGRLGHPHGRAHLLVAEPPCAHRRGATRRRAILTCSSRRPQKRRAPCARWSRWPVSSWARRAARSWNGSRDTTPVPGANAQLRRFCADLGRLLVASRPAESYDEGPGAPTSR